MTGAFAIGGRRIGPGHPTYVIAELSANHGGRYDVAVELIHAARAAGADAVKLQTYTADTLTVDAPGEWFRVGAGTLWAGRTLHDLYREAHTPWEWQPRLMQVAAEAGLDCFSTAYDPTAVEFLESLDVPAYKVASFEITDIPLIERIARTGKPIVLSTGMAGLDEIREAVAAVTRAGGQELALLKCTSAYPAPDQDMNLRTIPHLLATFGLPVGLSDHTLGTAVAAAAVALGACIVEKHLTLSRSRPGPDSAFSLEPAEFEAQVAAIRAVEQALGAEHYGPMGAENNSLAFRRSLFVVTEVRAGEVLTAAHVRSIRPAHGLHPRHLPEVLGRRAARDIPRGTPLTWDMLEP